ncbi:MAG: phage tail assembly protein [Oscillospiraceae bacterium]|nr:phage tail assembly protein [Oscillospiraceae bacterium]
MFQTEFDFKLPKGYVDSEGKVHKEGKMRLATAADEILPLKDPKIQQNPSYLSIVLLSRVITKLGSLENININIIEGLYTADLAFLQDMYQRINEVEEPKIKVTCKRCGESFMVPVNFTREG